MNILKRSIFRVDGIIKSIVDITPNIIDIASKQAAENLIYILRHQKFEIMEMPRLIKINQFLQTNHFINKSDRLFISEVMK